MPLPKKGTPEYEAWRNSQAYGRFREKQRRKAKHRWQDEEYREKQRETVIQAMRNVCAAKAYRQKLSQARLKLWQDEKYRESQKQIRQSEEFREKVSQVMLKTWQDPEYAQKILTQFLRQTRPEKEMEQLLDELFPGEYKYVGDGQFIIGGKNPDFININGQKKIIEVYGDYWHADDDPQERIDFFHRYGFDCLVIWESELQEVDSVVEKLVEFHTDVR